MKKIKRFLSQLFTAEISVRITDWAGFAFALRAYSPDNYFYQTLFGVGVTLPLAEFRFRLLQDGHTNVKFRPVVQAWLELWRLRVTTDQWQIVDRSNSLSCPDWGCEIQVSEVRTRTGIRVVWNRKTLCEWIPFRGKGRKF
jgi:hypothetical protein